ERAREMTENIKKIATITGLDLHFDSAKPTNTYHAHRLAKYALTHNKNVAITEKLFEAHFTNAEDIGNVDTLIQIDTDIGLKSDEVSAVLHDESNYSNEVQFDLDEAKQFNITGVPFFVFNRKLALSGAQDVNIFQQAL